MSDPNRCFWCDGRGSVDRNPAGPQRCIHCNGTGRNDPPAPLLPEPQEVAPTSTRSSTAGSTDKGCDPADERSAFEATMLKLGVMPGTLKRSINGYVFLQIAWSAWQARAAIGQPAPTGGTKEPQ